MSETLLQRHLWYNDRHDRVVVNQDFLKTDSRSLVILGEAGMGKSTLLANLKDCESFAVCTARKLIVTSNPKAVLGRATTLVVDALDEVSAQREGDAVDAVLRRLVELDQPRFILSCRVADWRSATALQGFTNFYEEAPLELHLEPLSRNDALAFLAATLGSAEAEQAIDHLEAHGLSGLWHNPQTLQLIEKVAKQGKLPDSKGELFAESTKLLRAEHRRERAMSPLASLPEATVLDAAGASFAALILTGKEAVSREVSPDETDAELIEISALPSAGQINDVLESRLFEARSSDRFTYAHRAIGEFLGARWLAKQANTPRKRRRLLELLNNHALVPANLRGIHAWLAWHSPSLADKVITADPMGVVEYGDADTLNPAQGRALLNALYALSRENPRFRDWSDYRVGSLVQSALLPEVRKVIGDSSVEFGLRLLVLQALKGSALLSTLRANLLELLFDEKADFALRSEAGERLAELDTAADWPTVITKLIAHPSEDNARLGSELMEQLGYQKFDDELILDTVKAQFTRAERSIGVFFGLERNLPLERIDALLDGLAAIAVKFGNRHERHANDAMTDLAFALVARRLTAPKLDAKRLWSWLRPFNAHYGTQRETRKAVADAFTADVLLRRAVQYHVIFEIDNEKTIWQRALRMMEPTSGLQPSEDDVIWLLDQIDSDDMRWRELVDLARHGPTEGARVRAAAERFAEGNTDDQSWLKQLGELHVPDWQIEQEQRQREREAKRKEEWERHRTKFAARIESMRAGNYGDVVNPAMAYLKLFNDIGDEATDGLGRLEEWLGAELRDAALAGFNAFLIAEPPKPTAKEIAVSYAKSKHWSASYIIVAALAERLRTNRGFDDLPDERLMAGYFELLSSQISSHAGLGNLDVQLANTLRERGQWEAAQRIFFEPHFAARLQHITGLYSLMRDPDNEDIAERLAAEWLDKFPEMSGEAEAELLDRLFTTTTGIATIRAQLSERLKGPLSDQRRLTWDAVGLILDFDTTRARLEKAGPINKAILWELRARLSDRNRTRLTVVLSPDQLAWMISTFRAAFPYIYQPQGVTTGDTNRWDATEYLIGLINRLGDEITPSATWALVALRNAPDDGYTEHLRVALAEQKRKRVEAEWVPPDLRAVTAAIADQAPTTASQLQVVILEELAQVQAKIRGSDVDWYKDFFVGSTPKGEEDCRDTILKMFGELPFGILASAEGHLADDKRCDIECTLSKIMVPIELKGQWHKDLWTAADRQLDLLYTNDWRAERGIYVVLWFGHDSSKKPRKPPSGISPPKTAEGLREALVAQSATTREGRTEIVVLDLTRPT